MTRQELITSKDFILKNIQDDIFSELSAQPGVLYLKNIDVAKQLAQKYCLRPNLVKDALSGDYNGNLSNLVDIFRAVGKRVVIRFEDINTDPMQTPAP